ncbi:EAL domain-containing protein [Sphingomonas sp. RS6]
MSIMHMAGCASDRASKRALLTPNPDAKRSITEQSNVLFTIEIVNIRDILKYYGEPLVPGILRAVAVAIERLNGCGVVEVVAARRLRCSFPRDQVGGEDALAGSCEDWIRRICHSIALIPFATELGVAHVRLSGCWLVEGAEVAFGGGLLCDSPGAAEGAFGDEMASGEEAVRYRRDMALASKLLCALADLDGNGLGRGGLRIAWRPVVARASCEVLYYQSTVRLDGAACDPWMVRNVLPAVQRLGFGGVVDEVIACGAVAELAADRAVVLSAPISSEGVTGSAWWRRLRARLERQPEMASRLVLEIGETTPLARSSEVGRFCDEVRRLGCLIAVSGFGAGFASVRQLVTVAPDIVKIDCGFVRRSTTSSRDRAILEGLVRLAGAVGSIVVADGVDTLAQAQLAEEVGLAWQQGHFWGEASAYRPWCGSRTPSALSRSRLAS